MASAWGEEWLLRQAIQVDGKEAVVGPIPARLESILAMSFWGLSRTNCKVYAMICQAALEYRGRENPPWSLDGAPQSSLQWKNPANIHEEACFLYLYWSKCWNLLPILKNKLKASYWNSEMRKGSSSLITEWESCQFAGMSRSTRLSHSTQNPLRVFIMAFGTQ